MTINPDPDAFSWGWMAWGILIGVVVWLGACGIAWWQGRGRRG